MVLVLMMLAALGVLSYAFQRQLLFPAPKQNVVLTSAHHRIEAVRIALDDKVLCGYLARPVSEQEPARGLLYFNGRRENPTSIFRALADMPDHAVLCFYQDGLGLSWRKPGEAQLIADGCAVLDWWTREQGLLLDHISVAGRSLGSGIAVQVATLRPINRLLLISPHDRLISAIRTISRWVPSWWLKDKFDSIAHMPNVTCPCLLVVGERDRTIPLASSRALFAGWNGALTEHLVRDAGHRGLLKRRDVQRVLGAFVSNQRGPYWATADAAPLGFRKKNRRTAAARAAT